MEDSLSFANRQKVSYLRARDPSLFSYSQMCQAREKVKHNLDHDFQKVSDQYLLEDDNQCLKVYLRIKTTNDFSNLYKVIDDNSFISKISEDSLSARNSRENDWNRYEFSKIFGTDSTQGELFSSVVKPKILNFINGRNCTLMAYGASGSGKTYTMIGTAEQPGIIPRALEYLFRTLPQLEHEPDFRVNSQLNKLEFLSTQARGTEIRSTQNLLEKAHVFEEYKKQVCTYRQMQVRLSNNPFAQIESAPDLLGVWVSFAEIYNEQIYDLLVPPVNRGQIRPTLKVGGSSGEAFIRGLRRFYVKSGLEAYGLLQYGLQNLKYAETAINSHSSRSHSIFSIVLVQAAREDLAGAVISVFNFCDLAGSERSKKTMNVGSRLKESGNINNSLLVLGRCIKNIREGQVNKENAPMPPFRDSKLTQLFQKALSGQEDIMMMVNINPVKEMFEETQHVLNFSAVAKRILIEEEVKAEVAVEPSDEDNKLAELREMKQECQYFRRIVATTTLEANDLEQENDRLRDALSEVNLKLSVIEEDWAKRVDEAVMSERSYMMEQHKILNDFENGRIKTLEKKNQDCQAEIKRLQEEIRRLKHGDDSDDDSSSSEVASEGDSFGDDVICLDDLTTSNDHD